MEYIKAIEKDIDAVYELVNETIKAIYPKYYPAEVVDFFCKHHCKENIAKDIEDGRVGILVVDDAMVGTGCYKDNHITRVYVKPKYQGRGYGSYIMQCLEADIAKNHDSVELDASLPASHLYEKRGYKTVKHEKWNVENSVVLVYEIMEKPLASVTTDICYDGRFFVPKINTDNGEVDWFGQNVETWLFNPISKIISTNVMANSKNIENIVTMTDDDMNHISLYLAIQMIRSKEFREKFICGEYELDETDIDDVDDIIGIGTGLEL